VAYLKASLAYCATLGAFDRDQLLMMTRSSIILFSDRGKPYWPVTKPFLVTKLQVTAYVFGWNYASNLSYSATSNAVPFHRKFFVQHTISALQGFHPPNMSDDISSRPEW